MKFRVPEIILGALLAVAVFAMGALFASSFSAPQGSAEHSIRAEKPAKEDIKHGFWEKTADDPVAYFTLWLVGFTGVLAISTIGLGIATVFLYRAGEKQIEVARVAADAAKRAADAAVETERGRVLVIMESDNLHEVLKGPRIYDNSPSMNDGLIEIPIFRFRLKNFGKTPLVMSYRAHGMMLVAAREPLGPRHWQPQFGRGLETLASGETTSLFECFPFSSIRFADGRDIVTGKSDLVAFGRVDYVDGFNQERTLNWEARGTNAGFRISSYDEQP